MAKNKEIWFAVEEIPQNHPFMMSGAVKFMIQEWPKRGLGNFVSKYFTWFEKDVGKMCYLRKEFDAQSNFLAQKMLSDPKWAMKVIADVEEYSRKFFKEAGKFSRLNLSKLSLKQILGAWEKPLKWHILSHGIGASVSWCADAERERVTKGILSMVEKQIKSRKLKVDIAEVFTILSTPEKESPIKKEEIDLLLLVTKKVGLKEIRAHAKKYEWLNYQYAGPVFSFQYFLDRFKALKPKQARDFLKKIERRDQQTASKKDQLLNKLKFDKYQLNLIKMAQAMVFIKDYRKEALYHGHYSYEPFFRELGRRFGFSIDQVRAMNYFEIIDLLKKGKGLSADQLNERLKFAIMVTTPKTFITYTGVIAKTFLSKIKFEKVKKIVGNEFVGTCAYPGKVRGQVKIINLPEDMHKMEKGDILVAWNTNPNLIPAMRMASAMVSGAGGLTCHTAIVARELHTPSIVGIPNIHKMLKDGDLVEVDANKGIVRKIKSAEN